MIHSYRDNATVIPPTVGILISLYFLHLLFSKMSDKNEWLASDCFFTIQSVLSININSPIRKLLLSIIESFSGYLIDAKYMSNTLFTNFLTELKNQIGICEIRWMEETNSVFIEEDSPSEKVVIAEEELDGIDTDCFENLRIYLE